MLLYAYDLAYLTILICIYDHNSEMGISIPVDMEHYKELKIISDNLGVGLKKTLEYLIKYYWKEEMSKKPTIETKPVEYGEERQVSETEANNESLPDLKSVSGYEISSKIPPYLERRIITHLPERTLDESKDSLE